MTSISEISINDLKTFASHPENRELAATYLTLQAEAKRLRAAMDELYEPIFAQYDFRDKRGNALTREQLYRCTDEQSVAQYHEATDQAVRAAGYDVPKDVCPALVAQNNVIKHEWKILEAMSKLLGKGALSASGKTRDKILQFFMKVAGNLN